jgi:hypothetical protein
VSDDDKRKAAAAMRVADEMTAVAGRAA